MRASDHHSRQSARAMTVAGFVLTALCILPEPLQAQSTNQIVAVVPSSAAQGTTGLLVTFTLDTDSPPAPPSNVPPDAATIGTLAGASASHPSQYQVTAVFTIPASEPVGPRDCAVTFPTPEGTLTFSAAGAFAITAMPETPPTITVQPQSRNVRPGASVTFTVAATGSEPLRYQWQKDGVDIGGATAPSHTVDAVAPADAGSYRCLVTNDFGSATSDVAVLTVDTDPPSAANSSLAVDTGQVLCYDTAAAVPCPAPGQPFSGQDAQHQGFPPSFTSSGDGLTVYDHATGLTWQSSPDTDGDGIVGSVDKLTWVEAQARPAALNAVSFGGFDDWRLPTITELYSLIDFRGTDPSGLPGDDTSFLVPFIDTQHFAFAYGDPDIGERIIDSQYASSTLYAADPNTLFGVNFADGRIKGYDLTMPDGSQKTFFVQCVRGNPSYGSPILVDNGDDTVTDRAADLMWAQSDSGVAMTWQDALAWVEARNASSYLGHDDWRLPNAKELQSLLDYDRSPDTTGSAAIAPLFGVTPVTNEGDEADFPFYWASTTHGVWDGSGPSAVYVAFGRALGWIQLPGDTCYTLVDVHGAGAQRSDPKSGSVSSYYLGTACSGGSAYGHGPQGDVIRISNFVRLVRGGDGPLEASFSFSPDEPAELEPVTFTAVASGALSPYAYAWDLGGAAATGRVVTHAFAAGTHVVTLHLTDAAGFSATATESLVVAGAGVIFTDGFESGDASAWSGAVGGD